jgi:hypothetical protein
MYLKNQSGKYYYTANGISKWVDVLEEATLFTPEEARGTHYHKFNSNENIKIV